jgi:hypothetical protein
MSAKPVALKGEVLQLPNMAGRAPGPHDPQDSLELLGRPRGAKNRDAKGA